MPEKPAYEELEQRVQDLEKAENALRESEEKCRFLLENITDVIWTMDLDMRITYFSPSIQLVLGYTSKQAMALPLKDLMSPDSYSRCLRVYHDEVAKEQRGERNREPVQVELELIAKDGSTVIGEVQANFVYDQENAPTGIIGMMRDITEGRRTLLELEESRTILRTVFDATPNCVFVKDHDGRYFLVNNAIARLYHSTPDEMLGRTDMELAKMGRLGLEEAVAFMADDREVIETKRPRAIPSEALTREDGTTSWFYTTKAPISLPHNPDCMLGVAIDITKLKETEQALRSERERFKQILEGFPYGIYIVDQNYCVEYVNRFLRDQFGEPLDLKCYAYFHGLPSPCPWCQNNKVFKGETVCWDWHSSKTGKHYELVDLPLKNNDGTISKLEVFQDVTDRKRAEKALAESERRFRTIIESASLAILAVREGKFVFVNPAGAKLCGYANAEEMIGLDALHSVAPEYRDIVRRRITKVEVGQENPPIDYQMLRCNGERLWVKSSSVVIDFEGKPTTLILGRDVAREKLAEEERARLMSAIEQSDEAIVITDRKGDIQYVNPSFERVTGYKKDQVIGRNPRIVKSGKHDEAFYKDLWQTIVSGKTWKNRIVNRRKDGSLYTEECSISPVVDERGDIANFVAVKRDVTSEIEMEKRLAQAQKMEAIGNLAGGIAHDFNNILSPIMLHAELAMMDLPEDSPLQMNMKQIYKSGDRARKLVQQILTFARVKEKEKIPLKASLIVKEAVKFLRATIPSIVDLSYEINTDRDMVLADPTQMHQIVMNLCTNAAHAMRETGGQLKVMLMEARVAPEETNGIGEVVLGDFLKMSVSDTGSGVPPDIVDKIFDPYFTTKEQGQGTGLGLAVVHGIVKSCNGHIAVESEVGKGSVFHVYLPIVDAHASTVQEEKSELPKGTEHILLVDDEQAAVTAIQPLLERLGYRITAKTDSLEALDLFREAPEAFDVVITDQTMPRMTGKDLALELMAVRPDIPIILCTGFSEQINEDAAKRMGIRAFVPKPIVMHQMARAIREAVE